MQLWMAFQTSGDLNPRRRKDYFLRLYDGPRFPREVFEDFRAQVTSAGGNWIDVLRQLIECHNNRKEDKHG